MNFETLLRDGIPDRFFTRSNAVATALIFCTVVVVIGAVVGRVSRFVNGPPQAPACMRASQPITEFVTASVAESHNYVFTAGLGATPVEEVLGAQAACRLDACDRNAARAYKGKLAGYLADRMIRTHNMQSSSGRDGLKDAIATYSRPADRDIEDGLRQRYAVGLIDIAVGGDDFREAVLTLAQRGRDAVIFCEQRGAAPAR